MSDEISIVLASTALASRLGVEKSHMLETIKGQCFPNTRPDQVSDTQLAAFVQIAQSLNLNPLLPGMLYSYPGKNGGIIPMIGPDGVFTLLASNPEIAGWTTTHGQTEDKELFAIATIKHKRLGEISYTAFLSEWRVASNPNWGSRPRHMLGIRALKHAARQIIHGIPFDPDEREIIDIQEDPAKQLANTPSPTAEQIAAKRAALPTKAKGVSAMKTVTELAPEPKPEKPADVKTPAPTAGPDISAPTAEPPPAKAAGATEAPASAPTPTPQTAPDSTDGRAVTPPHPQPEGWPLVIEAFVMEASPIGMTIPGANPGDPTMKAKSLQCVLGGPGADKLQTLAGGMKAMVNPYDLLRLEGKTKPGITPAKFTLEFWQSVKNPALYFTVIMDVAAIEDDTF